MRWDRLQSLRGRILIWYVGALSVVLLGYCVFQTVTLTGSFRAVNALSMQGTASAELNAMGPCFVLSPADVKRSARPLAWLLGSQGDTATIVTTTGAILAGHSTSPLGPPQPSVSLIRRLTPSRATAEESDRAWPPACQGGAPHNGIEQYPSSPPAVRSGDVLRTAVLLGPATHPAGYAIVGRSVAAESAALTRLRLTLWAGALLVLLVTALVALPIMDHALRPLTRVTATAEAIAAGDLGRRARVGASVDEIGRLSDAFDTMVDRLHGALTSARSSEEHMRRFLADASHELRTPLTVLCGTAEILRRHDLDPRETHAAHLAISEEAARMARLVDDLLRLSRLDAGQILHPRALSLAAFLEDFITRYAPAWPQRSLQLDRSNLNGTQVHVDPEALTRVITNLVDNAARYSAPGESIRIRVTAAERTVSVAVSDAGPGLDPEDARRAFERFYRGSKSRSRESGGSGLGLAIVQALIRQSEGEVGLETGPDRGTTVTVTLPGVFPWA